ncbi:M15 family metallopeptidase [Candidiatus Paracoxiella cheracis]|uniref:M15 family metallopeptidase n=1 Tax=Candidiatus Paracoxiella cheracis TaxID=3405120 RepID=UPI003BF536B5
MKILSKNTLWSLAACFLAAAAVLLIYFTAKTHRHPANYYLFSHFQGSIKPLSVQRQVLLMTKGVWGPTCPIPPRHLTLVTYSYWDYHGTPHVNEGELIVNRKFAKQVLAIFKTVYQRRFPIDKDHTEAFDCRPITGQQHVYSEHAYGRAIDVNFIQNPISSWKGNKYLNRKIVCTGMIMPNSIVVKTFKKYGWAWGGDWKEPKDYMHFQKSLPSRETYLKLSHKWPDLTWFIYNPNPK